MNCVPWLLAGNWCPVAWWHPTGASRPVPYKWAGRLPSGEWVIVEAYEV